MTSCGQMEKAKSGHEAKVFHVNDSGSYGSAVLSLIKNKDLLTKYLPKDVTVEWTKVEGGANIRDAVVAGEADCATFAGATFISGIENNMPLVLLSNGSDGPSILYSNNPNISSLKDITANSRISLTNKGTNMHLAFMAACKDEFNDPNKFDSQLVSMANADALASLASSKDLDCALLTFPSTIKAKKINGLVSILDLSDVAVKYGIGSYLVANKDFYEKNPDLINALNKAYIDAIELMKKEPAETAQTLSEAYGIEASYIEEIIKAHPPRLEVSGYDKVADLLYKAGILKEQPKKFSELPNYTEIPKAD